MGNPVIADNKPTKVKLEKDEEYLFCTCGRSDKQPFCDGSHAGTGGHLPGKFSIDDLSTWNRDMALLSGVRYAGVLDPST